MHSFGVFLIAEYSADLRNLLLELEKAFYWGIYSQSMEF